MLPWYKKLEICGPFRPLSSVRMQRLWKIVTEVVDQKLPQMQNLGDYWIQIQIEKIMCRCDQCSSSDKQIEKEAKRSDQEEFNDLQKAFDTLDHDTSLTKLEKYGFRGTMSDLLRSYLDGRRKFVFVTYLTSSKIYIETGVQQGSILGPFLFFASCKLSC